MTRAGLALRVSVAGREVVLDGDEEVTVGRAPGVGIQVDDQLVSRHHAVLRLELDGWVFEDEMSTNGTFCDGERIRRLEVGGPRSVRLGDPACGPELRLTPALVPSGAGDRSATVVEPLAAASSSPPREGGLGRLTGVHAAQRLLTIGRARENDVVLNDLLVSRRHAELRPASGGSFELVDLGSDNGTFVNGRRMDRVRLEPLDVVGIGRHSFRLVDGMLTVYEDTGDVTFQAAGLTVRTARGAVVLDDVGFTLRERSLLAVVGPSGAGKSTLLKALAGLRPAPQGTVLYDGRDLYEHFSELRGRIGYVPQTDILHPELSIASALEYASELRFPADVARDDRLVRVATVMDELGLTQRRDVRIGDLSGGQRKRTSVALELLTKPSLLFLDEPTSGLDPGLERSLMKLMRTLADGGRTVVVVTHSVQSLRLCDRVLFLAPGGRPAFFGPAQLAPEYFGCNDLQDVFQALGQEGTDWASRFRSHPYHARFVDERPAAPGPRQPEGHDGVDERIAERVAQGRRSLRQLGTLTRRYVQVLAGDRRNLALLLLQAPLLGLLLLVALPVDELAEPPAGHIRLISKAGLVLLLLVMGATWLGASNAAREIVKELPIFRRERAAGLSIPAYVASKAIVLGALTTIQSVVLFALATARQGGPRDAILVGWPTGELAVVVALTGLAGMALGLLISASAARVDRAMTLLPIVLLVELILAMGAIFPEMTAKPVLKQAAYGAGTQWGFSALAATSDLNRVQLLNNVANEFPTVDLTDPGGSLGRLLALHEGEPRWDHEPAAWLLAVGALVMLTAAAVVGAGLLLRRHDRDLTP